MLDGERLGEIGRVMDGQPLGRPKPVRYRYGRWHRDPGAEWDWWYDLPADERARIQRSHMRKGGVRPDVVATWLNTSVDDAMGRWVLAIRDTRSHTTDEWEFPEDPYEGIPEFLGTKGLAELFGVGLSTPRQWKARGQLPEPDFVLDGTHNVWSKQTIGEWLDAILVLTS